MTPVSTSPVPAVASAGPPVRFTTACPSGAAITVPGPFNKTIASKRVREVAGGGDAIVTDRPAREALVLAAVRREHRERKARASTRAQH